MYSSNRIRLTIATAAALAVGVIASPAFAASQIAKPTIASFAPVKAKAKAMITIHGTNLTGTKTVKVDGMTATFKVVSPTELTITLPSKVKSGKIAVTTSGGQATSSLSLKVS